MIDAINLFAQLWWDWMAMISWQVGLLIVFVTCIDRLIRRWAWPQLRYALWSLVLIKLLLPPTFALPSALTPRLKPWLDKAIVLTAQPEPPTASKMPALESLANVSIVTMVRPEPGGVTAPKFVPVETETVVSVSKPGPVASFLSALNWRVYVMAVWAVGVLVLGAFLAIRLYWLSKGSGFGSADGSLPESFYNRMQYCARRLELRRLPKVVVTRNLSCPAVFGIFRPVLLMPQNYLGKLSGKDVEHMLLHELAHIKRGDLIVHGLFMCLQIVYWYNPLLWLVRRQVHHLRELCCDATVARLLKHKTSAYRQTLLETARRFLSTNIEPGLGLLGLFEDSNRLLVRLNWLEKPTWRYRKMKNTIVLTVIALMLAYVLPMAQVQRTIAAEDDQAKQQQAETEVKLKQVQAKLQQKQQELQSQLKELDVKRHELQAQLQALDAARQAEKVKKAEVLVKKVNVQEQLVHAQEMQVQARQMQDWQKQIDQWQDSDAMKKWRQEIEQRAHKQALIDLGQAEGPLPPAPAMPPMPAVPMPATPPTEMSIISTPTVAPATVPVVKSVTETVVIPAPSEVQNKNISINVNHEEHGLATTITPHASVQASVEAPAAGGSISMKTHSIVADSPNTIRMIHSIKEKENKGRWTIERIEMQMLPFSSGAALNVTNEDGVIDVKGADVDTCLVQAIVTVQGSAMETVRTVSKQVSFDMDQTDKGIDIAVVEPKKMQTDCSANVALQILVPRNINLSIKHEDGAVQLKDLQGRIKVQVEDGTISCEDITAEADLNLEDGKINVKRSAFLNGRIAMEDGQIECEDIKGNLACALEEGKVKIVYSDDVPETCAVAVMVVEGGVEFSAPSVIFGPDAPEAAKRVGEGAEWKTVVGNRTIVLKAQEGSVNVQKR